MDIMDIELNDQTIIQYQEYKPLEGDTVEMVMKIRAKDSKFIMMEVVPAKGGTQVQEVADTAPFTVRVPQAIERDHSKPCRRGDQTLDKRGQSFAHDYTLGYCIFCNDGLPQPGPADPNANIYKNGGEEKIWCDVHGFHLLKVKPDGTYDNAPKDCQLFTVNGQP